MSTIVFKRQGQLKWRWREVAAFGGSHIREYLEIHVEIPVDADSSHRAQAYAYVVQEEHVGTEWAL